MDESKIETTIGMCVVALAKYIMHTQKLDYETAYKKLLLTELFKLLQDKETRLFWNQMSFCVWHTTKNIHPAKMLYMNL